MHDKSASVDHSRRDILRFAAASAVGLALPSRPLCSPLHLAASPDHSGQQACSHLDPTMCYSWATSQAPRSMLLRSGIRI